MFQLFQKVLADEITDVIAGSVSSTKATLIDVMNDNIVIIFEVLGALLAVLVGFYLLSRVIYGWKKW